MKANYVPHLKTKTNPKASFVKLFIVGSTCTREFLIIYEFFNIYQNVVKNIPSKYGCKNRQIFVVIKPVTRYIE